MGIVREPMCYLSVKLGVWMHIVTGSDENYVTGVLVLIASAHRHNPDARFTVLTTDWSQASLAKLQALQARLGILLQRLELSKEHLAQFPIGREHLTGAAYARLLIPDLLPQEDRVIYMDCDMLVTGSLQRAWSVDLTDKVLAAVRCPAPTPAHAAAINLPITQYFNSGFLVMNLALFRAESLSKSCFDALMAPDCSYLSEDESALNVVARGRVEYLDAGFNLYALDLVWQSPLSDPPSIKVIHFFTRPKPWNGPCPFGALWQAECRKMPELTDFRRKPETIRAKLTRWNRIRKAVMGSWGGKEKYKGFGETHALVHKRLVPIYLATGAFPSA
jgi:lipopolysaccharide biosynthesis glycosyltransferase